MKLKIIENDKMKMVRSEGYNYDFDKESGFFVRYGKTLKDDPEFAPSPEILDIEVSTICSGIGSSCDFCYKSNTLNGRNMTLETFSKILSKMPKTLCQVALGAGNIDANPDLYKIMQHCRDNGVVPNITINGARMNDYHYEMLAKLCGAVSVSKYHDKNFCYNAVKELTNRGLKQVNIHQLISAETLDACYEVIDDFSSDERLSKLNAIVFMTLKPKGDRNNLSILPYEDYKKLIEYAINKNTPIGSDSCGSGAMYKVFKDLDKEDVAKQYIESCESFGLFSSYINVSGFYYPCSFAEGEKGWEEGFSVLDCEDFSKDIWFSKKMNKYREISLNTKDCNGCRRCLIFNEVNI